MDLQKNISISDDNEKYTLITLNVPIDMDNGPAIEAGILEVFKSSKENVVLDLSNTQFIFSSGMGIITRLTTTAHKNDKTFFIVNTPDKVYIALEAVGLFKVIKVFKTLEEMEATL